MIYYFGTGLSRDYLGQAEKSQSEIDVLFSFAELNNKPTSVEFLRALLDSIKRNVPDLELWAPKAKRRPRQEPPPKANTLLK